jgi:hypothetical protein
MKEKKRKRIKVRKTTLKLKSILIKANINYSYGS